MPKLYDFKFKDHIPNNILEAVYLDDFSKDILGYLLMSDCNYFVMSKDDIRNVFERRKSTFINALRQLMECGFVAVENISFGEDVDIKVLRENI